MIIVPGLHLAQNACMSLGLGRIQCAGTGNGWHYPGPYAPAGSVPRPAYMRKAPNFVWGTDHMLKLCVKLVVI